VKAERLPGWALRRLNAEQRQAYDRLRWENPGLADRARAKLVLGWKRTREETVALAAELLAEGLLPAAVADRLGVTDRHMRRIAADLRREGSEPPENRVANPHPQRPRADTTCEPNPVVPPAGARPPIGGFATVADLDAWLEEHR
jgi:hypothetical protein